MAGGFVCDRHGGRAPQVRRKAAQRVADMLADAIDPNRVLREVGRLAYSDIRQLYDEDGRLLPIKQWPDDIARCVRSVETIRGNADRGDGQFDELLKVQLWDRPGKLQDLMKHHGQLTERVNLTVTGLDERIKAARKRVGQ
jgi:phage terminase small subunit